MLRTIFVRQADGSGLVIDVRPEARIKPEGRLVFDATAELCATVGWDYRRLGDLPGVARAHRHWVAGYRHPRCRNQETARAALKHLVAEGPCSIRSLSCFLGAPVLVLPTIFHLMWCQEIVADLDSHRLHLDSRVWAGGTP
ncbi:TnsA-like heteromeric transposase endonuclease subunit [Arthrobacter sp. AQ5-05]|uniref:TnsA-like heteromeric transposase endonuclease subunit n=1 Tax=Arthrobacter sp. AQ5-05 TaxID=2184581 RepID=UPI0015EB9F4A